MKLRHRWAAGRERGQPLTGRLNQSAKSSFPSRSRLESELAGGGAVGVRRRNCGVLGHGVPGIDRECTGIQHFGIIAKDTIAITVELSAYEPAFIVPAV